MTPYVVLGVAVLAVLATTILALAFSPRPRKPSPPFHVTPKLDISFDKIKRELPTNEQRVFGKRNITFEKIAPPDRVGE